jgi:hypothetical protein
MVDHATMLLQSSPEFAVLDESVRGQLLEAVRVAALSTGTAGIDIDKDRLVARGTDEAVQMAHETIEDTAGMAGDGAAVDTVGPVVDGTETTATEVGKGALGVAGALARRRRATRARAQAADTSSMPTWRTPATMWTPRRTRRQHGPTRHPPHTTTTPRSGSGPARPRHSAV